MNVNKDEKNDKNTKLEKDIDDKFEWPTIFMELSQRKMNVMSTVFSILFQDLKLNDKEKDNISFTFEKFLREFLESNNILSKEQKLNLGRLLTRKMKEQDANDLQTIKLQLQYSPPYKTDTELGKIHGWWEALQPSIQLHHVRSLAEDLKIGTEIKKKKDILVEIYSKYPRLGYSGPTGPTGPRGNYMGYDDTMWYLNNNINCGTISVTNTMNYPITLTNNTNYPVTITNGTNNTMTTTGFNNYVISNRNIN